eukprot:41780-Eustigmatos_ZCMA.PRE.1
MLYDHGVVGWRTTAGPGVKLKHGATSDIRNVGFGGGSPADRSDHRCSLSPHSNDQDGRKGSL